MGVTYGRHQPPYQPVSIAHIKTNRQIQFDNPDDMLKTLARNPGLEEQVVKGEWQWTTQPIQGGS